jgi:hypothetical protein
MRATAWKAKNRGNLKEINHARLEGFIFEAISGRTQQ